MYRGTRYRVSCAELGLPRDLWTREGSYQRANEWWRSKHATLDTPPHPHPAALRELGQRWRYAKDHGMAEEAQEIVAHARQVIRTEEDGEPDPPGAALFEEVLRCAGWSGPPLDPDVLRALVPSEHVWAERLRRAEAHAPADKTVGWWADKWLALKVEEGAKGVRSEKGLSMIRFGVAHFKTSAGAATPVANIDAALWDRWATDCLAKLAQRDKRQGGWSSDYAKRVYDVGRAFVKWLWARGALQDLPRNFGERRKFTRPAPAIVTFSVPEVRSILGAARGVHKLYVGLGLNCGYYGGDLRDLLRAEVDLRAGTITRRRSKTRKQKHTPLVCYRLWPWVLKLLKEHMAKSGELALPAVPKNMPSTFRRVFRRAGLAAGAMFKTLRKTSATLLRGNKDYQDLRSHFLGHAPPRMDDRHYSPPTQAAFDAGVAWLGEQYGPA
jgi:integrase